MIKSVGLSDIEELVESVWISIEFVFRKSELDKSVNLSDLVKLSISVTLFESEAFKSVSLSDKIEVLISVIYSLELEATILVILSDKLDKSVGLFVK